MTGAGELAAGILDGRKRPSLAWGPERKEEIAEALISEGTRRLVERGAFSPAERDVLAGLERTVPDDERTSALRGWDRFFEQVSLLRELAQVPQPKDARSSSWRRRPEVRALLAGHTPGRVLASAGAALGLDDESARAARELLARHWGAAAPHLRLWPETPGRSKTAALYLAGALELASASRAWWSRPVLVTGALGPDGRAERIDELRSKLEHARDDLLCSTIFVPSGQIDEARRVVDEIIDDLARQTGEYAHGRPGQTIVESLRRETLVVGFSSAQDLLVRFGLTAQEVELTGVVGAYRASLEKITTWSGRTYEASSLPRLNVRGVSGPWSVAAIVQATGAGGVTALVTGAPGAGKSVGLRQLAREWCRDAAAGVALIVDAKRLVEREFQLELALADELRARLPSSREVDVLVRATREPLYDGLFALFVDGIDEVSAEARARIDAVIGGWRGPVVVAGRPIVGDRRGHLRYEVEPLRREQCDQLLALEGRPDLVDVLGAVEGAVRGAPVRGPSETLRQIARLGDTPLGVSLLARSEVTITSETRPADVFRGAVRMLIHRARSTSRIRVEDEELALSPRGLSALGRLAWESLAGERPVITAAQLAALERAPHDDAVREVVRNGDLAQAMSPGVWQFAHKVLAEYLAAEYLAAASTSDDELLSRVGDPGIDSVISLLGSLVTPSRACRILAALLASDRPFSGLALALRLLAGVPLDDSLAPLVVEIVRRGLYAATRERARLPAGLAHDVDLWIAIPRWRRVLAPNLDVLMRALPATERATLEGRSFVVAPVAERLSIALDVEQPVRIELTFESWEQRLSRRPGTRIEDELYAIAQASEFPDEIRERAARAWWQRRDGSSAVSLRRAVRLLTSVGPGALGGALSNVARHGSDDIVREAFVRLASREPLEASGTPVAPEALRDGIDFRRVFASTALEPKAADYSVHWLAERLLGSESVGARRWAARLFFQHPGDVLWSSGRRPDAAVLLTDADDVVACLGLQSLFVQREPAAPPLHAPNEIARLRRSENRDVRLTAIAVSTCSTTPPTFEDLLAAAVEIHERPLERHLLWYPSADHLLEDAVQTALAENESLADALAELDEDVLANLLGGPWRSNRLSRILLRSKEPTRRCRALLYSNDRHVIDALRNDPDEAVRSAGEQAVAHVERLKASRHLQPSTPEIAALFDIETLEQFGTFQELWDALARHRAPGFHVDRRQGLPYVPDASVLARLRALGADTRGEQVLAGLRHPVLADYACGLLFQNQLPEAVLDALVLDGRPHWSVMQLACWGTVELARKAAEYLVTVADSLAYDHRDHLVNEPPRAWPQQRVPYAPEAERFVHLLRQLASDRPLFQIVERAQHLPLIEAVIWELDGNWSSYESHGRLLDPKLRELLCSWTSHPDVIRRAIGWWMLLGDLPSDAARARLGGEDADGPVACALVRHLALEPSERDRETFLRAMTSNSRALAEEAAQALLRLDPVGMLPVIIELLVPNAARDEGPRMGRPELVSTLLRVAIEHAPRELKAQLLGKLPVDAAVARSLVHLVRDAFDLLLLTPAAVHPPDAANADAQALRNAFERVRRYDGLSTIRDEIGVRAILHPAFASWRRWLAAQGITPDSLTRELEERLVREPRDEDAANLLLRAHDGERRLSEAWRRSGAEFWPVPPT